MILYGINEIGRTVTVKISKNRQRIGYLTAFIILFLIEAAIALWVHDRFVRPYIGDVLVVVLVYVFVRIFFPSGIRHLVLYVFLFAACVEVLQYFHLVEILGLQEFRAARIILGSVFDLKDIACYGVGCLGLWMFERLGRSHGKMTEEDRS
ncbi:DUF2809 domain-containing protein [Enterocloster hominis (ex Hitch et al. 2024)]|uniref:ribosomal maturation YjgA family protein n=1 Tax=Enterocloster hominis (ex Hitch et al. 2024) TaxID=1917870 RepID=UPI003B51ABC9